MLPGLDDVAASMEGFSRGGARMETLLFHLQQIQAQLMIWRRGLPLDARREAGTLAELP